MNIFKRKTAVAKDVELGVPTPRMSRESINPTNDKIRLITAYNRGRRKEFMNILEQKYPQYKPAETRCLEVDCLDVLLKIVFEYPLCSKILKLMQNHILINEDNCECIISKLLKLDSYINLMQVMEINEAERGQNKPYDVYICKLLGVKSYNEITLEKILELEDKNVMINVMKYLLDFQKWNFTKSQAMDDRFLKESDESCHFLNIVIGCIFQHPGIGQHLNKYIRIMKGKMKSEGSISLQELEIDCNILIQMAYYCRFQMAVQWLLECQELDLNKLKMRGMDQQNIVFIASRNGFSKMLELIFKRNNIKPINDDSSVFLECLKGCRSQRTSEYYDKTSIFHIDYNKSFELIVNYESFDEILFTSNPMSDSIEYRSEHAGFALIKKYGLSPFIETMNKNVLQEFLDFRVSECKSIQKITDENSKTKYISDSTIKIDYRFLNSDLLSTGFLKKLIKYDDVDDSLTHPVLKFFVELKNRRFKTLYWLKTLYFVLTIMLPIYMAYKFEDKQYHFILYIFSALCLIYCEFIEFACLFVGYYNTKKHGIFLSLLKSLKEYFTSSSNVVDFLLVDLLFALAIANLLGDYQYAEHIMLSMISILLSIEMTIFVTYIVPSLAIYLFMIRKVARTFLTTLMFFFVVLATFAFNFYLIFNSSVNVDLASNGTRIDSTEDSEKDFHRFLNPLSAILKIHVMLTGEYEAASLPFNGWYSELLFLVFLFIAILIFNFTNALAIDDVHQIRKEAELNSIKILISNIDTHEKFFDPFFKPSSKDTCWLVKLFKFIVKILFGLFVSKPLDFVSYQIVPKKYNKELQNKKETLKSNKIHKMFKEVIKRKEERKKMLHGQQETTHHFSNPLTTST